MVQLLQLDGELPDHFPGHARRLHILVCRNVGCNRKEGSIRAVRSIKVSSAALRPDLRPPTSCLSGSSPIKDLGKELFQGKMPRPGPLGANPFSGSYARSRTEGIAGGEERLFSSLQARTPPNASDDSEKDLMDHFERIPSSPRVVLDQNNASTARVSPPAHSTVFPLSYLDAEYESLESPYQTAPPSIEGLQLVHDVGDREVSSQGSEGTYESSIDRAFQRFAARLAQNPQQVLRYEFRGVPLLYSSTDKIGKLFSHQQLASYGSKPSKPGLPPCPNCGAERVFELQITPHTIMEVERDEHGSQGMEWGTIVLAVCGADCQGNKSGFDQVVHVEEWLGIQWEERKA